MGQCTKPGGFKACDKECCLGCPNHIVNYYSDMSNEEIEYEDIEINQMEFEKIANQLHKLFEEPLINSFTNSDIVPLTECQHSTILIYNCENKCGYICDQCKKQMKFVNDKFVEM